MVTLRPDYQSPGGETMLVSPLEIQWHTIISIYAIAHICRLAGVALMTSFGSGSSLGFQIRSALWSSHRPGMSWLPQAHSPLTVEAECLQMHRQAPCLHPSQRAGISPPFPVGRTAKSQCKSCGHGEQWRNGTSYSVSLDPCVKLSLEPCNKKNAICLFK